MPPIQVSGEIEVTIGDRTQIGPGVQILAADHPRDAATRNVAAGATVVGNPAGPPQPLKWQRLV
ncbi:hypothetical protein [Achromobacter marplatensis]|uniref:Uncharacterized protein n=1 Tax=Achromobacter marplatensis TaxID=470868 RepID=A0AA43B0A3_9BURK|nr:hypothetical protein [Achromobacter marplatensis]MDH2049652.1 hypothetical protein [Achromobacter marplatensis]